MNAIPLQTLRYVTVVTGDARATARNYADFYGIERWNVTHATPDRLSLVTIRGRVPTAAPPFDLDGPAPTPNGYAFLSALGTTPGGNLTFQLVQPVSGLSTFEEFLVTRGPGVHGPFATVLGAAEFAALRAWLAGEGIAVAQSYRLGGADYAFFDMRPLLGSFFVQVVVPHSDGWERLPADEVWDFSGSVTRPAGLTIAADATGISHLGVVVENLTDRLPHFARLFGQPVWRGMHWRTAPGSLEDTTNNGRPVAHGYFTARADLGVNPSGLPFGFEVIQPAAGPSHYKEDYLHVLGPGIHHVDVRIPIADWARWESVNGWLADAFGAPTCMSGWLRNHTSLFHYQDTRERLGYVTEISAPRAAPGPRRAWQPDYWYDFSAQAL
jgi:hypothetical protein